MLGFKLIDQYFQNLLKVNLRKQQALIFLNEITSELRHV